MSFWNAPRADIPPLLLTSSIIVTAPLTALTDAATRINLTLQSIEKWLEFDKNIRIVVCDGSNFDLTSVVSARFPHAAIECICFENNQTLVKAYGKGYGEGEIIDFALKHSETLQSADAFIKCTSKLWVKNFPEMMRYWNGKFLCDCDCFGFSEKNNIRIRTIDTRFYMVDRKFYKDHFSTAHLKTRDLTGHYLEHCFRDIVNTDGITHFMPPVIPEITGMAGSTATLYTTPLRVRIRNRFRRIILRMKTDLVIQR